MLAPTVHMRANEAHKNTSAPTGGMNMNRIMTAFALSGLLISAPAFAKSHKPVATAGDKAPAGEKSGEAKAEGSSETKTETAKPKKTKKTKKTEEAKPAEAPAK